MKLVSLVAPCINEKAHVDELCDCVRRLMEAFAQYLYDRKFTCQHTQAGRLASTGFVMNQWQWPGFDPGISAPVIRRVLDTIHTFRGADAPAGV